MFTDADLSELIQEVEQAQPSRLGDDAEKGGAFVEVGRELHGLLPALDDVAAGFGRSTSNGHGHLPRVSVVDAAEQHPVFVTRSALPSPRPSSSPRARRCRYTCPSVSSSFDVVGLPKTSFTVNVGGHHRLPLSWGLGSTPRGSARLARIVLLQRLDEGSGAVGIGRRQEDEDVILPLLEMAAPTLRETCPTSGTTSTYVLANLELLQELLLPESPDSKPALEPGVLLDEMWEGLQRVRSTIRDLKIFSRSDAHARLQSTSPACSSRRSLSERVMKRRPAQSVALTRAAFAASPFG